MKAFWVPSKTPEAKVLVEQPDMQTRCPASGNPLRYKDLSTVQFTRPLNNSDAAHAIDPITSDTLTNSQRLVLLKPTGGSPSALWWISVQAASTYECKESVS